MNLAKSSITTMRFLAPTSSLIGSLSCLSHHITVSAEICAPRFCEVRGSPV